MRKRQCFPSFLCLRHNAACWEEDEYGAEECIKLLFNFAKIVVSKTAIHYNVKKSGVSPSSGMETLATGWFL